jgi:Ulp1 family protease
MVDLRRFLICFNGVLQLYFPVVKDYHWIVCSVNLVHKQYHIFDSLLKADGTSKLQEAANNLVSDTNSSCSICVLKIND